MSDAESILKKKKFKVELFVKFLYPGIILKGDSFTEDGTKIYDGFKPFDEGTIGRLKMLNIQKIYYVREGFAGKTSGENMMISDEKLKEAFDLTKAIEDAAKNRAIIPEKEVNRLVDSFVDSIKSTDNAILNLLEIRDYDDSTYTHSINVSLLAILFAKRLNYNDQGLKVIGTAGLLHDIGKTMIPQELLNKNGPLTDSEYEIFKKHPVYGYEILKSMPDINPLVQKIVLLHHEKVSGKGYPFGLRGEQMGEASQIISICDVFDDVTSDKPYKKARPFWYALTEINKQNSISFSPRLAKTFVKDIPAYLTESEIFAKGSFIALNSGELGEVVDYRTPQSLTPTVHLYINSKKELLRHPIQINLEFDDSRFIEAVIEDPGLVQKMMEIRSRLVKKPDKDEKIADALSALQAGEKPEKPAEQVGAAVQAAKVDPGVVTADESSLKK